ncbi:phage major capsid family protein [Faecalibaculum rodentium]|uniref:phage major capsid family protein n=1 Tax=Faecalibaculum rodentium TaxID=1702221 RepID=UPI0025B7A274|nr:phage major capsid protein [Faecalibaculum rodentium]
MAENNKTTTSTELFSPQQIGEIFNRVAGHSTIAALSGQSPIPFAGVESYVFTMDGEAAIVGEGEAKPAGEAKFSKVLVKPLKVVYQHRLTDEFKYMADEAALPYLEAFMDGFAKKIARALDIMAFHGLNPATKEASELIGNNCFDKKITETVDFEAANADDNIQAAVNTVQGKDRYTNGLAMTPAFATAMGNIKEKTGSKVPLYPEFRFGGHPQTFGGMKADVNNTLAFGSSTKAGDKNDEAIIGDFQNALKWGYTNSMKTELIEYGDPDGQGDLKNHNQVVLRAEAYIGWGILDNDSFVRIVKAVPAA